MGWCIFQKREIYDYIHLSEDIDFWYSDNDYAEQLKKQNIKHALIKNSIVHHTKEIYGKTISKLNEKDKYNFTIKQKELFDKKWQNLD